MFSFPSMVRTMAIQFRPVCLDASMYSFQGQRSGFTVLYQHTSRRPLVL